VNANGAKSFFLSDHLGSTAITVDSSGNIYGELRYSAWGETRYNRSSDGSLPAEQRHDTPTSRRFTGQAQEELLGIYFFEARWFDPGPGRFLSPDSVVPDLYNSLDWDRYAFVRGNPLRYSDPSGHSVCDMGKYADPECKGLKINRRPQPPQPPVVETSTDLSSQLRDDKSDDKDNNLSFDPSLGENYKSDQEDQTSDKKPSVIALVLIGIPLSVATVIVDGAIVVGEVALMDATVAVPALAPTTVPLGLILAGTGLVITDLDFSYWVYTIRVANAPEGEPVKFEYLPPWGFGK
jgi:RHS repeat-associated protein